MSKATLVPGKPAVTETRVIHPEQPAKVVLELSPEEAQVIADLCYVVGGSPDRSRRRLTMAVMTSLIEAGIRDTGVKNNNYFPADMDPRGIYFRS